MSAAPPDIFLSYAHEDEAWVRPLATELSASGRTVFWDRRIPAGQTWRSHIGKAVKAARCVVVVWSAHSVDSEWVLEEADQGKRRGVLVPVLKEPVEPPMGFGQVQAADLSGWRRGAPSEQFTTLLDDLARFLGPASQPNVVGAAPSIPRKPDPADGARKGSFGSSPKLASAALLQPNSGGLYYALLGLVALVLVGAGVHLLIPGLRNAYLPEPEIQSPTPGARDPPLPAGDADTFLQALSGVEWLELYGCLRELGYDVTSDFGSNERYTKLILLAFQAKTGASGPSAALVKCRENLKIMQSFGNNKRA